MTDRERVIKGLECHLDTEADCADCIYVNSGFRCYAVLLEDALKVLKEQPEQKHGHWKGFTQSRYFGKDDYGEPIFRDGRFYVCSECRRKSVIKYRYCPHCGTKMDERVVNMDD